MFCPKIGLWTYGEDTKLDKSGSTSGCGKILSLITEKNVLNKSNSSLMIKVKPTSTIVPPCQTWLLEKDLHTGSTYN